jgi:Reverse transcriptase (RNA-dependent DNA polymerase)
VRGFTQIYGVDYYDTYSPVVKLESICTILAFVACYNWDAETFDFIRVYLNGELEADEDIYMQAPPGYEEQEGQVKHLKKSVTEVGTRWTLPLTDAVLRLPFLGDAYCSPSIVSLALLSHSLSSSGLLFFPCYCSCVAIVLTVPIVLPFW